MTSRIIQISPVDAEAHVYRTQPQSIIRVFDQCDGGLVPVQFRRHDDGMGFTLAHAPLGQVWAEVSDVVIAGLGSLATLNLGSIHAGRLAAGVRYSQEVCEGEAVAPKQDATSDLIAEVKALRSDMSVMLRLWQRFY